MGKKYTVEATVCDTIKSVPVEKEQARALSKQTKAKIPKAKVKIKKA